MIKLPKAITFDCYGTLIDWESEIRRFFAESMDLKGYGYVDPQTLQEEWEEIQFRYIQEKYRPYRQVLRDTLRMVFNPDYFVHHLWPVALYLQIIRILAA